MDICGVLGMHALRLASETPSALLDWNNNYGDDPNKGVCFHCTNLPKHFFSEVKMDFQEIIAGTVGKENTFGTCVGRVKAAPMSFARFSTDDADGQDARLRRRRRVHRRSAGDFRRRRRGRDSAAAEAAAITSANTASSTTWPPIFRVPLRRCTKPTTRYLGWDMYWHRTCMAIVAGVDFGT